MSIYTTKRSTQIEIPKEFTSDAIATLKRIEQRTSVSGVMFFKKDTVAMYTVPHRAEMILSKKLPMFSKRVEQALKEIDVMNDLVAYRIVTRKYEIAVVTDPEFAAVVVHKGKELLCKRTPKTKSTLKQLAMKIISNLLKDAQDEQLVKTTATINKCNPMVDRIMEDESVEGVVMTNSEGAPILTNISLTHASLVGRALHKYGAMTQMYIKELDPFDEVMAIRINTRKNEMILAPSRDFLVAVIQLASKLKDKGKIK